MQACQLHQTKLRINLQTEHRITCHFSYIKLFQRLTGQWWWHRPQSHSAKSCVKKHHSPYCSVCSFVRVHGQHTHTSRRFIQWLPNLFKGNSVSWGEHQPSCREIVSNQLCGTKPVIYLFLGSLPFSLKIINWLKRVLQQVAHFSPNIGQRSHTHTQI